MFTRRQPDLNWENPAVRDAVFEVMTWWLDKGIDCFRMDVINAISKVDGLPDAPNPDGHRYAWGGQFFINGPRVHDHIRKMHERVLSKYDVMTVGETGGVTTADALKYAGEDRHELNMVFQFEHMNLDSTHGDKWTVRPWDLRELKAVMSRWQDNLYGKAWNSLYWINHDQPRAVSRFGNDREYRVQSAKMLAVVLHMMQGTPYVYQGEEIGMTNAAFDSIQDYRDVEIHNLWRDRVVEGGQDPKSVMPAIQMKGRDNARTPMQWDDTDNAGFTSGTPWIRVNPNYRRINVKQALADEDSIFHFYKWLIAMRKVHPIMVYGKYDLLLPEDTRIYAYTRTLVDEKWLVVANFSDESPVFVLPAEVPGESGEVMIANEAVDGSESPRHFTLKPYECRVYRLTMYIRF